MSIFIYSVNTRVQCTAHNKDFSYSFFFKRNVGSGLFTW